LRRKLLKREAGAEVKIMTAEESAESMRESNAERCAKGSRLPKLKPASAPKANQAMSLATPCRLHLRLRDTQTPLKQDREHVLLPIKPAFVPSSVLPKAEQELAIVSMKLNSCRKSWPKVYSTVSMWRSSQKPSRMSSASG
jgi:hypothetical protein